MKKSELFNKWRVNGTNFESHVNYNYYLGVITKVDFFFFFTLYGGIEKLASNTSKRQC